VSAEGLLAGAAECDISKAAELRVPMLSGVLRHGSDTK
jgi:hypothetical protein